MIEITNLVMQENNQQYLNRSVLFMPVSNQRAVAKATTLAVDTVIIDLEDSVADSAKQQAVDLLGAALSQDFGKRRCLVRINAMSTPHWQNDIAALKHIVASGLNFDGIVLPKVESTEEIDTCVNAMDKAGIQSSLWIMVETSKGVQRVDELCAFGNPVTGIMIGTADLALDLGLPDVRYLDPGSRSDFPRIGLIHSLSRVVLAARAAGIIVIDGVYPHFRDATGFEREARQGLHLGFDGKSLIHPNQLDITHRVFTPSDEEVTEARALVAAWGDANRAGLAVCSHNGVMVEELHVRQAQKRISLYEMSH